MTDADSLDRLLDIYNEQLFHWLPFKLACAACAPGYVHDMWEAYQKYKDAPDLFLENFTAQTLEVFTIQQGLVSWTVSGSPERAADAAKVYQVAKCDGIKAAVLWKLAHD
jgi:hypothetical protein